MLDIDEVERIFCDAIEQPETTRWAFVRRQCAGDEELYSEVESLLKHAGKVAPGFLRPPELTLGGEEIASLLNSEDDDEQVPSHIGEYCVLDRIGSGGMGVVYRAQQVEPLERIVAIKVMRHGLNRRQSVWRFRLEQHALAAMQHPSIARVFDSGLTDDGRPFIVMEYIAGSPITEFCADPHRSLHDGLELFIQACEAVQHAHQKGIIHRDIKPSNVLVTTEEDGAPRVKIIDFSIAKPTKTIPALSAVTQHGEVLGSLNYMAPEQLIGTEDVDTRADIYALGAMMYELLTGCCAVEWNAVNRNTVLSAREAMEAPVPPSSRVKQLTTHRATPFGDASFLRQSPSLARRLRGDLDWIVLKSISFDREHRYGTAAELAEDIRRHLDSQPVLAGPPSALYRMRKFVARNRTWVTAASIIFTLLVLSLVGVTSQAFRATRARRAELNNAYMASIAAANSAIEARDLGNAQRYLNMAPVTHRGWEWRHLNSRLDSCDTVVKARGAVMAIALNHDSTTLACADERGVELCDGRTGERLARLESDHGTLQTIDLSPDGQLVAAGGFDGTVCVWHTRTLQQHASLGSDHGSSVVAVSFSGNGTYLAAVASDGTITIWSLDTLGIVHQWVAGTCWAIEFVGDRDSVAVACSDGTIRIFDCLSSTVVVVLTPSSKDRSRLRCLAVTRDGSKLAAGEQGGRVRVWDLATEQELVALETDGSDVTAVGFSGDGRYLASGSRDRAIHCWAVETWRGVPALRGHTKPITSLAFNDDGSHLFSGSSDRTVRIWGNAHDETQRTGMLARVQGQIIASDVSADGTLLVAAMKGAPARLQDFTSPNKSITMAANEGNAQAIAISPPGNRVALGIGNRLLFVDDPAIAAIRSATQSAEADIACMQFNRTGSLLATGAGNAVQLWNPATGTVIRTLTSPGAPVRNVAFSPDDTLVASASDAGTIELWEVESGQARGTLANGAAPLSGIAFSPDGLLLAAAEWEAGSVTVWSVKERRKVAVLPVESSATALAFTSDSKRVLVGAQTGEIQVWRVEQQDVILCLWSHDDWISSLIAQADGRVISTSWDGTIRAWEAR